MTTPILPEFVLKLFQDEVNSIVQKEICKVCEHFNLNKKEVFDKMGYVEINTTVAPGFRIMKKNEKFAPKESRCIARMLHDLEIKQCSYHRQNSSEFCGKHLSMKQSGKLKYGTVNDPLPDELRPEVLNEKKKKTIY